jgi:hypothetical protein
MNRFAGYRYHRYDSIGNSDTMATCSRRYLSVLMQSYSSDTDSSVIADSASDVSSETVDSTSATVDSAADAVEETAADPQQMPCLR